MYLWQRANWPEVTFDTSRLTQPLARTRHEQGLLLGRMQALGFTIQQESVLATLTEEVVSTSEIEGEIISTSQVRSSLASRLGIDIGGVDQVERNVEGIVEVMLDATHSFNRPLTAERLKRWQAALFPTQYSGLQSILTGQWRDDRSGPMQVVSGPIGRRQVHFEAPPADRIESEIERFLEWFESEADPDPVLKAGIAHLWFVTIHPFEDGNGRIARAIAEMVLARGEQNERRFYSLSSQIRAERREYYHRLESTQRGSLDITPWLEWFLACFARAIERAGETLMDSTRKARFWEQYAAESFTERQITMLNRILDGLEGRLTSSKWARMAGCSQDTAWRDITDLVDRGVLTKNPEGGRSTSYSLHDI